MKRNRTHKDLADHLLATAGAITHNDAISRFGIRALQTCQARGLVVRLLPNTYVHARLAGDPIVRMRAASLWASPRGAVTGPAAGWVWGLVKKPPGTVTVQLPQNLHLKRPDWLKIIRPELAMDVLRVKSVRVVSRADAVVQIWCEARPSDRIGRVVDAVREGNLQSAALKEAATRRKRVPDRPGLYFLLSLLDGGVKSFLEYHARTVVFPDRDFPGLVRQKHVLAAGLDRYLDLYDPEAKLAIELDGDQTHSGELNRIRDITRDAELATIGIATIHFPYEALMNRPEWCRQIYLRARGARLNSPDLVR